MKIVYPEIKILDGPYGMKIIRNIEEAARLCYKSISSDDNRAKDFVEDLISKDHLAMIEHGGSIRVWIQCDRGVSHEIVRHRLFSFAQESTRYCNYSRGKFGKEITVVHPQYITGPQLEVWEKSCLAAEKAYLELIESGLSPQLARNVLPHSLKTELIVTGNPREWRHFLELRTSPSVQPQMRYIANMILEEFKVKFPIVFDDI